MYVAVYDPNIICISETKICETFADNELLGDGYTLYRNDRKDGGGGVLIAIKNDKALQISNPIKGPGESITLTVRCGLMKFNLITYYRPPCEYSLENLEGILENSYHAESILIGDLNFPDIDWITPPHEGIIKQKTSRKNLHKHGQTIFKRNNLVQLVHDCTHVKGNTLDLALIDQAILETTQVNVAILPRISDHNMIMMDLKTNKLNRPKDDRCRARDNYKKADIPKINDIFDKLSESLEGKTANEMWEMFKATINDALDKHVPRLLDRPRGEPWMTRDLLRLIRQRDDIHARLKNADGSKCQKEIDMDKHVKKQIKLAKKAFLDEHITKELDIGNTKPLFKFINKHRGQSNQISTINNAEQDEIPDAIANFFSSVFVSGEDVLETDAVSDNNQKIRLSKTGIHNLIKMLDVRKASGPDEISNYTIKILCEQTDKFLDCIFLIYDTSLKNHSVPEDWKKARVVPIYKSGSRADPGNYRPISLTSVLGKILEHIISSQMWEHIQSEDILTNKQHGFRKGLNTTTQLLHVTHMAGKSVNEKKHFNMISFDFKKAFDKVCHEMLINKLHSQKFPLQIINWIKQWLSGRTSVVTVNSRTSSSFPVSSGVPQGSVLGPLLFLLYIDDITQNIESDIRLYADDALLCRNVENDDDALVFQRDIQNMFNWSQRWRMVFNVSKCVHIEIGEENPRYHFCLDGEIIPQDSKIKYLGVTIDYQLKFKDHIENIIKKGNQLLGMLRRCLNHANPKTKLVAFNTVVRPTVEYASQVWSPQVKKRITAIDCVQRKAVRWVYYLQPRDSVSGTMEANNIVSLVDRRQQLDIRMINKIQLGDYDISLKDYIIFVTSHDTRGNTINPQYNSNIFKHTFYNRMRTHVKVMF